MLNILSGSGVALAIILAHFVFSIAVFSCGRECQRGRTKSAPLLWCPQGLVYVGTCGMFGEHIGGEAESREQGGVGVMELSRGQLMIWPFYSMENDECST